MKDLFIKVSKFQIIRYLNGGVLMKAIAFFINFILNEYFKLNKYIAYIFVLIIDFIIGYFINRKYVFRSQSNDLKKQFTLFIIAGGLYRLLDWSIYTLLNYYTEIHYIIAQIISTGIVLIFKYLSYKRIFKN